MKEEKNPKISRKNLPDNFPLETFILIYLVMEKFPVPEWGWGVFWAVIVTVWVGGYMNSRKEKLTDIVQEVLNIKYELTRRN